MACVGDESWSNMLLTSVKFCFNFGSYSLDFITMATYHCCVLIWLVYLLAPDTARRAVKHVPDNNLEQWNTEMQRLLLR